MPDIPANPTDELTELKNYLRIDHDEDNAQLSMLMKAAHEYLANAGVVTNNDSPLFRLAVMLYVGVHYENRDGAQKIDGFSHALQSIILQLKAVRP